MKDIFEKINAIVTSDVDQVDFTDEENDYLEADDEFEIDELYTDTYVYVRNIDEYYGHVKSYKGALLLESFLLETMVLLKKNPENIVVESGEYYVKATSFTPNEEVVLSVFEDTVLINTMIDYYNEALAQLELPRLDVGIGLATFVKVELEHEHTHECDCEEGEQCSCGHNHEEDEDQELDYGIDFDNTAYHLSEIANSDELDPIVINDFTYEFLLSANKEFFEQNLAPYSLDEEEVIYHGNIVSE